MPEKPAAKEKKRVLFLTNSEYGQANVVLAVAYELLLRQEYEVHIGSFAPLGPRVKELNLLIPDNESPAVFQTVKGPAMLEAAYEKFKDIGPFRPGIFGAIDTYRVTLPALATAWDGPEYLVGYESCVDIINTINPDLLVVEPLFNQALDACESLSKSCVVLCPNTFRDILMKQQPVFHQLCRYPAIASAFPYPVPWYLVLANIYLKLRGLLILITNKPLKNFVKFRESHGLGKLPPAFNIWKAENHYLLPSLPETDFPCYISPNVTACGPLLLPAPPVAETDPELETWLRKGPTVLINLGSHIRMDDAMAREFSAALKVLLDSRPEIQILWKLKRKGGVRMGSKPISSANGSIGADVTDDSLKDISKEIKDGRVRCEEWLSVDPLAVLESGHVVCQVHHGGSNSFHEALSVGVPQVILPCWLDTFDFAHRIEYLGIGAFGSRKATPGVERNELSKALMRVLGDGQEAISMKKKAKELAEIAGKVGGRRKAVEKIVEFLDVS